MRRVARMIGPRAGTLLGALAVLTLLGGCGGPGGAGTDGSEAPGEASPGEGSALDMRAPARTTLIDLWSEGLPAFGVFVPDERERSERGPDGERLPPRYTVDGASELAADSLLDFVFLNLEGRYDPGAVTAVAEGLGRGASNREKSLLVRIPPMSEDGPDVTRERVLESLEEGADGIVFPHVRSPEEARMAVSLMEDAGADVWSPSNPDGTVLAMIMIEDPGALADVAEIADTPGYSVLACGIGSLTRALGGDREAAEAGNQEVLEHAKRVGRPDMITADADDVVRRIEEGFLGLLIVGPEPHEAIRIGREAAGR